jgi:hypothetical protein
MHGALDTTRGNEEVAIEVRHRGGGDDEAITVVVQDQTAADFVAGQDVLGRVVLGVFARLILRNSLGLLLGAAFIRAAPDETVAAAMDFLDGVSLLELSQNSKERAAIGLSEMQGTGNLVGGGGFAFNLQKTQ